MNDTEALRALIDASQQVDLRLQDFFVQTVIPAYLEVPVS